MMRAQLVLVSLLPLISSFTFTQRAGSVILETLPMPPRELIVTPKPAEFHPLRSFNDVISDVLTGVK